MIEREAHCPDCGELIASNRYGTTRDWTLSEMEKDWAALVAYKRESHSPICAAKLNEQFALDFS